jgi:hypothetical protein
MCGCDIYSCDKYYNLPSTKSMRTTGFGFGTRGNFILRAPSPPPNTYKLPSDFDEERQKGKMFSFGVSRNAYAKVYSQANLTADPTLPGPGAYSVRGVPGKNATKFSLGPKLNTSCTALMLRKCRQVAHTRHSRSWNVCSVGEHKSAREALCVEI